MRMLLSTIGSRGEAQPMVALALALRAQGHEAVVCAPPDFRDWVESQDVEYVAVGPEVRATAKRMPGGVATLDERQRMIDGTVATQFAAVGPAAEGCDVVVGGGALAIAAHSVAEWIGARYVYAAFAPITLPSPHHAPPTFGRFGQRQPDEPSDPASLWAADAQRWDTMWSTALNAQRDALGLAPVGNVRDHVFTDRPWLAADPVLAPWPPSPTLDVRQTGAWILPEPAPLSPAVEAFLESGGPPVYVGFGSVRAPAGVAEAVISVLRVRGLRAVISRGWAELEPPDEGSDCLVVDEVDHQALFGRVAAVLHHGGAGTTTAAACAGVPQLIAPQMFDQPYFAGRVEALGVGRAVPRTPTADDLGNALDRVLDPATVRRASAVASLMHSKGAYDAARQLTDPLRTTR